MSVSITVDVHCDNCQDWIGPATGLDHPRTVSEARRLARRQGWIRTRVRLKAFGDEMPRLREQDQVFDRCHGLGESPLSVFPLSRRMSGTHLRVPIPVPALASFRPHQRTTLSHHGHDATW